MCSPSKAILSSGTRFALKSLLLREATETTQESGTLVACILELNLLWLTVLSSAEKSKQAK
jgi:hypothetical protein